jgi:hypothetical protein
MADRYVAGLEHQSSSDDSDVPFINPGLYPDAGYPQRQPRVHPHRYFPTDRDSREIPTPANRPMLDFQDGMPTPTTERAPTEPWEEPGEEASRGADAVTPPPETQEREWGSPSWREESWPGGPNLPGARITRRQEFSLLSDALARAPYPALEQHLRFNQEVLRRHLFPEDDSGAEES